MMAVAGHSMTQSSSRLIPSPLHETSHQSVFDEILTMGFSPHIEPIQHDHHLLNRQFA
jgi:hypothetical protein